MMIPRASHTTAWQLEICLAALVFPGNEDMCQQQLGGSWLPAIAQDGTEHPNKGAGRQ
jgi:uncharacterized membrane protein